MNKKVIRKILFWLIPILITGSFIWIFELSIYPGPFHPNVYAPDERIKADLVQIIDIAQKEFKTNNSFATICARSGAQSVLNIISTPDLKLIHDDIMVMDGGINETCWSSSTAYCVKVKLNRPATQSTCVDSTGNFLTATNSTVSFCDANTPSGLTCVID